MAVHAEDDPQLGQPICPDCYDYPAFNWHAPELWRRFTIALRRALARRAGLTAAEFAQRCRVSFVKVAEFQRRGVVHFHALIRLDGPGEDYQPPQLSIDAAGLAEAIRVQVRLTVHDGRRTCATLLVDPRQVMQILRHAQIAVTMEIYAQASSRATRSALKRLGDSLGR